jgi:hypothetical protein
MMNEEMIMISEWKKSDWRSTETWESVNCSSGDVTITKIGENFVAHDPNGMLVSQFPDTWQNTVRMMECCFTWHIKAA